MDTHELAWAAGFFDGEGCTHVGITNKDRPKPTIRIVLAIDQLGDFALIRFRKATNNRGNIALVSTTGRRVYQYRVNTFWEVQMVMCVLWKYLSPPKKRQYKETVTKFLNSLAEQRDRAEAKVA